MHNCRFFLHFAGFGLAACWLSLFVSGAIFGQAASRKPEKLSPNKSLERSIKGGETQFFEFSLKKDEAAVVEVAQHGIDLTIKISAPEDQTPLLMESRGIRLWRESLSCLAKNKGKCRVEITPTLKDATAENYTIKLTKPHKTETADRDRQRAEQIFVEAQNLQASGLQMLSQAVEKYGESLELRGKIGDRQWEAITLLAQATANIDLTKFADAKVRLQSAREIFQQIGDRSGEGQIHTGFGVIHFYLGEYEAALSDYQAALVIAREIENRRDEIKLLLYIGYIYNAWSRYDEATDFFSQALTAARAVNDRLTEGYALHNLGNVSIYTSNYEKARNYYEQSLVIFRELKNRRWEGYANKTLGVVFYYLGQYEKAVEYYENALNISRELADRRGEAAALNNLGGVYSVLVQHEKAVNFFERSLKLTRELQDAGSEVNILYNLGEEYAVLGQYEKARNYQEQTLALARQLKERYFEGNALNGLGNIYTSQGNFENAGKIYEQALIVFREVKNRFGEAEVLNNLGSIYDKLKQPEKSRVNLEEALKIRLELGDRMGISRSYYNFGEKYFTDKMFDRAVENYERAVVISNEINDLTGTSYAFGGLMYAWKEKGDLQKAGFYGKQAINIFQQIRHNLKILDQETQKTFLLNKEPFYRDLADILISQGRIPEAQIVLDLLKEEEFEKTARRGDEKADETIPYNKTEAETIAKIDRLVALGREQSELQKEQKETGDGFPAAKRARLEQVTADIKTANAEFAKSLDALGNAESSVSARATEIKGEQNLQSALASLGEELDTGTVALYTVIGTDAVNQNTDDKGAKSVRAKFGWVILVTPDDRKAYPIDVENLEQNVFQFRAALSNDRYDPQPLAQKIYNQIFRQTSKQQKITLEADLEKVLSKYKNKTIMWSLDGVLRYIPMAALYDGKNYLVENYRNVVFTKESLLWLMSPSKTKWQTLGLGVSEKRDDFDALPGVERELADIIKQKDEKTGILDGIRKLNGDFKKQEILDLAHEDYSLVHIASHYSFNPTRQEDSYLLVGDGKLTFADLSGVKNIFRRLDLLTLSACDTGVAGNGKEAEGFAYLAQSLGAKSVIASLWKVSDTGTPELMIRFYKLRAAHPEMAKGEAFRAAQLSLLEGDNVIAGNISKALTRTGVFGVNDRKIELPPFVKDEKKPFAHPYYWSSFVLIGNWR